MGKLFYYFCKNYVNIGLFFFFKKIKVVGRENMLEHGAVLFVANHQNALLDALLIATRIQRETHFVARADVFKKPFIKKLLALFYMMPIYRISDGIQSLAKNDEIFEKCKQILLDKEGLMIFPEGNHNLQRRLRPLSKGFTRIVFGALDMEPNLNLKIVPVGINYTHHQYYRGSVSLYFGEPIDAKAYQNTDFNVASQQLKDITADRLKTLITHIEDTETYHVQLVRLEAMNPDYLDPKETNLKLSQLQKENRKVVEKQPSKLKKLRSFVMGLIKLPVYINNILPIAIWLWIRRGVKDPVMVASIKFCVGISVFPIFYLLQVMLVTIYFGEWAGISYFLFSIISLPIISHPQRASNY